MGFLKLVASIIGCSISFRNPVFQLLWLSQAIWPQWAFLSQMANINEPSSQAPLGLDSSSQCIQTPTHPDPVPVMPGPLGLI